MAEVITRFKLETSQFDSKLRDAAKELRDVAKEAERGGKDFNNFSQKSVEAARSLGNVASGAKNTKDRVKDLVGAYNEAAKAYNSLNQAQQQSDFGKALAQSIGQLKVRISEAKQELYGLNDAVGKAGGGGLLSGLGGKMEGALAVFGGNLMTKAAGWAASFASEIGDMVQQGVELARQGEGIRIAFERIGRGDLLDGLRKATHGTVTDIELMKAAVKFNDFKLPLDELGTMLAFAQQKAKDTGQSVDYMVDSIVTGLGRKSLMILDNLGLSAAEIKDKMAETGDMTKAVGAIIREQMAKAGDYVETAADRAAQANVSLQNKMEELGRKFAPVEEASNQLWTSIKIGILDIIGGPLATLLNQLTEAGRLKNALNGINSSTGTGQTHSGKTLGMLKHYSGDKQGLYNRQVARYNELESNAWREANRLREQLNNLRKQQRDNPVAGNIQPLINEATRQLEKAESTAKAWRQINSEYQTGAKSILNPAKVSIDTSGAEQNITSLTKKLKDLQEQRKKAIAAGDSDLSKNLLKQINQTKADIKGLGGSVSTSTTGHHKVTDQERAEQKVAEAERTYAETLLKNSIRMEAGLDSTLENKKKELSAQERLFDAYSDAYATYKDPAYKEASRQAAEKIKALAEEVKSLTDTHEASKKAARELESAQKKLADAQQKLADAQATGSATAVYKAQKDVDRQQEVINRLQNPSLPVPSKPTGFEAYKQSVQAEIKFDQMQVDENTLHSLLQTALKNGLEGLTVDYSGLQERIAKGIDIPDSTWESLQEKINAELKKLGIEPIKIDFKTGGLEEAGKDAKSATKDFQQAASAIGSVGSALSSIEDPGAKVAGIVAQAIATVASAFAGALGTDTTTKSNIWAFIAAAAASTATMVSTIASIHSATGYAQGGQIKGNSYSGDNIPIMANAGEVVLTRAQQGNLASQLEGAATNVHVTGEVHGTKLVLVMNRALKVAGKGEIVTWK